MYILFINQNILTKEIVSNMIVCCLKHFLDIKRSVKNKHVYVSNIHLQDSNVKISIVLNIKRTLSNHTAKRFINFNGGG